MGGVTTPCHSKEYSVDDAEAKVLDLIFGSWRSQILGSTEQRYVKFHRDTGRCPMRSQRPYPGWRGEGYSLRVRMK